MSKSASADWRKAAVSGYVLIILTFGVAGGWAAVAKLDSAVVAGGFVAVDTNRKVVQHYEGGIIDEILIKEGDSVQEGQVLFRIQKIQAQANYDLQNNQLNSALAIEARLLAERRLADDIEWPKEFADVSDKLQLQTLMRDEAAQFKERRQSLNNQSNVLESRIKQIAIEISGIEIQRQAAEKQLEFMQTELVNLRELQTRQLIAAQRVFALERERERLQGDIGRLIAEAAKGRGTTEEIKLQIQQLNQKFQEDAASALLDIRQKISDLRERIRVAHDVLRRVDIIAPRKGTVQNLKVFTIGQVVRAGEPLLEIVPDDEPLIIQAQISPTDIDSIKVGQMAEIQFPSFHDRQAPLMLGRLESVSRDRLIDEASRQPYFLGIISISRAEMPEIFKNRVRPGMPAEILVAAGERTALNYLVSPLANSLRKSFTEH